MGRARRFDTGATRDTDEGKYDFEGFLSPRVLWAFAEHMHQNRQQSDGALRDSDNWQKGIPRAQYMKSLIRHVMDLWMIYRGHRVIRPEDGHEVSIDETLGAIFFNLQGFWHELLKERDLAAADHPAGS